MAQDGPERCLAPLRFHDLRHTAAALAIRAGARPKAIQARLGHASISTTLNVYGHLFPELDERLADRLDEMACAAETGQTRDTDGTHAAPVLAFAAESTL